MGEGLTSIKSTAILRPYLNAEVIAKIGLR
jgi:hypothetical protein